MGLFDFVKDAGQTIGDLVDLNPILADSGIEIEEPNVEFNDGVATVYGKVKNQADREKVILFLGNISGVEKVEDNLDVTDQEGEAEFYTVKSGDTLSKIARSFYGNAMKYNVIFEANTPMLENPDKIYPGQVLRIPKL